MYSIVLSTCKCGWVEMCCLIVIVGMGGCGCMCLQTNVDGCHIFCFILGS